MDKSGTGRNISPAATREARLMASAITRFPDARLIRRIEDVTDDVVEKMLAAGCTPRQSEAVRQATMFSLATAEYQRLACQHIGATFPRKMRTRMLAVIRDAASRQAR